MSRFFNQKEEVLQIELTPYGKVLMDTPVHLKDDTEARLVVLNPLALWLLS